MTQTEMDRRRRRLLVRSLAGGAPDSYRTTLFEPGDKEPSLPPTGLDSASPTPGTLKDAPPHPGMERLPEPVQGRAVLPLEQAVIGPFRVIESQLDSVLRSLGAVPPPVAPRTVPSPDRPSASPAPPALMLPPFQSLPTRRPAPTSGSRRSEKPPLPPPPEAAPTATKPAVNVTDSLPEIPTEQPVSPVVLRAPAETATLPVSAAHTSPVPPAGSNPVTMDEDFAAAPQNLAERSAALRSRSKIGVMKQDSAALQARLKELARLLEASPDSPSDEAICAWDDCRRLALMLHHELDRGLPQAEPQRGSRAVARPR
jgi:hypothetical protein